MSYTQAKHILKNTKIDKTRKDWTVDEDIENFYDSYSDHIHKTRFFIYEHRKNPHLYEPIYKCRNADKSETIIIFNEYIYARLEQDNTTACTNYIQKVGLQDILVSFRNYFNNNYGENTGKQCIHHINQLIARDTAVINHWIRTLSKLKSSLQHWIDLRIPEILKREIDKATARHYKAINRTTKERKMFLNNIEKQSPLLEKSRNSFTYLEEVTKMITKITRQNKQWERYEFDFNVSLLDHCPDGMTYRKHYDTYYKSWPHKVVDNNVDALDDMFAQLIEDFEINLSVYEVNSMNREYNDFINWLNDYKKELRGYPEVTQKMLNYINPNAYINMGRKHAKEQKMTPL